MICFIGFVILFVVSNCAGDPATSAAGYGNYGDYQEIACVDTTDEEPEPEIYRPCCLKDYNCIRNYLASHSKCCRSYGRTPDPIQLPFEKFYFGSTEMTITHTDLTITGFNTARLKEFYVNKASGAVVIAVELKETNLTSNKAFFSYQRPAKEPLTLVDINTFVVESVILTAYIPRAPYLRLDLADIYATLPARKINFYIGPKAIPCKDPTAKSSFNSFVSNVSGVAKEAYVIHSYLLMTTFIQRELCDFGVSYKNYLGLFAHTGIILPPDVVRSFETYPTVI